MRLEFHPEAEDELIGAAAYYESSVPGLGARFGAEAQRVTQLLLENPRAGTPLDLDLRHALLRRFPVALIYSVTPDILRIVAVAHQSRRPGYWRTRIAP